jgi:hypothetical protein
VVRRSGQTVTFVSKQFAVLDDISHNYVLAKFKMTVRPRQRGMKDDAGRSQK